ncbi:probable membrane-associated kinase regulator 3 [Humulus lupulus]|uniref:probable membrane-associated kinase regulator 3 n=1 Tax=Humulus lupulus TaxID=3486 RepID=UPI002B410BB4|nr:probable membrane-associated kinase regulator 3 [Humulus lupulus]
MATTTNLIEEDYIDMEITSSSSSSLSSSDLFRYAFNSPPPPPSPPQQSSKEFEFQMSSSDSYFPADELFYKGKLLPLHLPPRLQMVQKIIQSSNTEEDDEEEAFEDTFTIIPFSFSSSSSTAPCTNTSTPLESSPSESCRVSCDLNPDEYLSQWANEVRVFINGGGGGRLPKIKSWSWKLKQSSLGRKLKASRAFLKSLFNNNNTKSSEESPTPPTTTTTSSSTCNDSVKNGDKNGRYQKISTLMKSIEYEIMAEAAAASGNNSNNTSHRKSFSGVIQRHSGAKSLCTSTSSSGSSSSSSSSSFSLSSNGSHDLQFLKRSSSSANSELESSIQGAIAHCKQSSQQPLFSVSYRSKTLTQDGTFPWCSSRIAG